MNLVSLWDPFGRSYAPPRVWFPTTGTEVSHEGHKKHIVLVGAPLLPGFILVAHRAHEGHEERKVLIVNYLIINFFEHGVFVGSFWSELRSSQGSYWLHTEPRRPRRAQRM